MKFEQKHTRILREALARLAKLGHPAINAVVKEGLQSFAREIKSYCKCVEQAWIPGEGMYGCLDCGKRHLKLQDKPHPFDSDTGGDLEC